MKRVSWLLAAALAACTKAATPPPYLAMPVVRGDIVVSTEASGTIQPDTIVDVKSKASGEILEILATTGRHVRRGDLLLRVDPRQARNAVAQADADLDVARASLQNVAAQKERADQLFASKVITQVEHEQAILDHARASAQVVKAQITLENAKLELEGTDIRAPVSGTIIEQDVERGQIVSSATTNVGGGSVLLRIADISLVQVRMLVDQTDIAKLGPGMTASITVDAFPNRTFPGTVLKIEPSAVTQQNVTMFPVRVRIENPGELLQPGMDCDVEIHVARRDSVMTIPYAALRTSRDVASAAGVLGLSSDSLARQLAAAGPGDRPVAETLVVGGRGGRRGGERAVAESTAAIAPRASLGGEYIVFVLRNHAPMAVRVRTGLTDLDDVEVLSGLTLGDTVLVLPSASLAQSQQEFQRRVGQMSGGALPGVRQTPSTTPAPSSRTGGSR